MEGRSVSFSEAWLNVEEIPSSILRTARHNGVPLGSYPSEKWCLVGFPEAKGPVFSSDNLATVNDFSFCTLEPFQKALAAGLGRWPGSSNRDISWRLHVFLWAASSALLRNPASNFLELGTGRGFMAAAFCEAAEGPSFARPGHFFLADKFSGGRPSRNTVHRADVSTDSFFMYAPDSLEVRDYFARFPFVQLIEGDLPDSLPLSLMEDLSFVHVDLNDGEVEYQSLDLIREALLPGSMILFDDTGFPGEQVSLQLHRRWAEEIGAPLLQLPTGQSLLIYPG